MFSVKMNSAFESSATLIARTAIEHAISLLAEKYGFSAQEATDCIFGNGIEVSKSLLPRDELPWCGKAYEECCQALVVNNGLFTQCPRKREGDWCKACAKQVVKDGTPKNGCVQARLSTPVMAYKVGKRTVVPYSEYMTKKNLTKELVLESAAAYGLTIDPVQFDERKRGRPAGSRSMTSDPIPEPNDEGEPEVAPTRESITAMEDKTLRALASEHDINVRNEGGKYFTSKKLREQLFTKLNL